MLENGEIDFSRSTAPLPRRAGGVKYGIQPGSLIPTGAWQLDDPLFDTNAESCLAPLKCPRGVAKDC